MTNRSETTRQRYQLLLVCILSLNFGIVFFDRNALGFLMPTIKPELGLSNSQVGAITSALSLTWAVSCLVMGRISDEIGRRKAILILCTIVFSCTSFLSGMAVSFATLLAARLFMGIAEGGVMPISEALIVAEVDPARRGLAMGVMQNLCSNLLGNFLGPVILIAIATAYGWRSAFYIAGLPVLAVAIVMAMVIVDPAVENARREPTKPPLAAAGELLRNWNVLACVCMSILLAGFIMILATFLPLVLINEKHVDTRTMGFLMATFGFSSMICGVAIPGASDVFGRKPVIIIAAAAGMVLSLGVLFAQNVLWQMFLVIGLGGAITGVFPNVMATVPSESVPRESMATVLGLAMGAGEIIGGVLAPFIAGHAADAFCLNTTLWIMALLSFATALVGFVIRETARSRRSLPIGAAYGAEMGR
jgi:MFS family permease